jgi:hypothetical protein
MTSAMLSEQASLGQLPSSHVSKQPCTINTVNMYLYATRRPEPNQTRNLPQCSVLCVFLLFITAAFLQILMASPGGDRRACSGHL